MTDGDSIAQVAVVILLLGMAVPALSTAHEQAGTPFEYTEDMTVVDNGTSTVNQSATVEGYGANVTIVTDNDQTLTEDEDYEWYPNNGTVEWINTQATSDGETVHITYDAFQRTGETKMAWTIIAPLMGLFGLFGLVASVRALWQFAAEVWDL